MQVNFQIICWFSNSYYGPIETLVKSAYHNRQPGRFSLWLAKVKREVWIFPEDIKKDPDSRPGPSTYTLYLITYNFLLNCDGYFDVFPSKDETFVIYIIGKAFA